MFFIRFKCAFLVISPTPSNPCNPSPCGPNSQCRVINEQAICSCLPGYTNSPPNCRPECTISSECNPEKACINQKCVDPCPGSCGTNTNCATINHSPICSCKNGFTGDPFTTCYAIPCENHLYFHLSSADNLNHFSTYHYS